MNPVLVRNVYTSTSTIGDLLIAHKVFCHTLEDVRRPGAQKVFGETAIPAGRYPLSLEYSQKFKKVLPHIRGVQNFTSIEMHGGNRPEDTDGCVLCAFNIVDNWTIQAQAADALTELMKTSNGLNQSWIEIIDTFPYVGTE